MMKQLFLMTALVVSINLQAQPDEYKRAMQENIQLLDSAKIPQQFEKAAGIFSSLYEAGNQWQALYYQCLALIKESKAELDADNKESALKKAEELISKLPKQNDEVLVLKAYHAQILLGLHHELWGTYLPVINQSLDSAKLLNAGNPRVYYLKGLMTYYMPENMGGGKEKGLQLFYQALDKYKRFQPNAEYAPYWGRQEVEKYIALAK